MPIKLSTILPNPNNPRLIKTERFKKLVKSIQEFPKMMELRPMVINADNIVLGGNMRLKALKELGYKEIPNEWVKKASDLTEDEAKRFIIADNVGFGEHDWDLLANEWDVEQLSDWGLDVPIFDNNINDIEEVEEFNESVNFTIKCDSITQLEQLQTKLNVSGSQISYNDFLLKSAL